VWKIMFLKIINIFLNTTIHKFNFPYVCNQMWMLKKIASIVMTKQMENIIYGSFCSKRRTWCSEMFAIVCSKILWMTSWNESIQSISSSNRLMTNLVCQHLASLFSNSFTSTIWGSLLRLELWRTLLFGSRYCSTIRTDMIQTPTSIHP